MYLLVSKIFIFLLAMSLGIVASLIFDFAGFFELEKKNTTDTAVYYFSLGALVGVASLIWNIFNQIQIIEIAKINESKSYALKSYDIFASKPVIDALDIFDKLLTDIEEKVHTNNDTIKIADGLKDILDNESQSKITKAQRLCEEADEYMKEINHESNFAEKLFRRQSEKPTDDLFMDFLQYGMEHSTNLETRRKFLNDVRYEFIKIRAILRAEIAKKSKQIAKSFS